MATSIFYGLGTFYGIFFFLKPFTFIMAASCQHSYGANTSLVIYPVQT